MNVSLTRQLEQLVNEKVNSGMYRTASEVIREGLRLLMERDRRLERLRADIRAGFTQIERGEFSQYDETTTTKLARAISAGGRSRQSPRRY
mgnify:CR=1 FL=1